MDAPGAPAREATEQNGTGETTVSTPSVASSEEKPLTEETRAPGSGSEETESRPRWRRRLAIIVGVITLIVAAIVLPPLVNIGRYKHQVASLMTQSLGRPVRLSSVGLRLLPMPGFILNDLSVSEDPRFGAEPVLSAGRVVATVNLFSLWRGQLQISRISVDEASLNLVRRADGRWNLDALMIGAQPALTGHGGEPGKPVPRSYAHFPYLEATDSRVNLKNGADKSPFALAGTDLSLWQDSPGQWRFRLKGQPVRTDIPMSLADTGEVRAEGSLRSAAQLRDMPLDLQVEWREAQLGQLSRLLLGSDSGWRGDVRANIEVHGTSENAQTRARLRVLGIRREDVAPLTALSFDANCTLRYQHSLQAIHDLGCDTESGGGQVHLRAELPGAAGQPEGTLEAHDVPVQGGLDLLRSVRGSFAPGLTVAGKINGSLVYKHVVEPAAGDGKQAADAHRHRVGSKAAGQTAPPLDLRGEMTVDGVQLQSDRLKSPLVLPRMVWTPVRLGARGASADGTLQQMATEIGLATRFTASLGTGKTPPATSQPASQTGQSAAQPADHPQAVKITSPAPEGIAPKSSSAGKDSAAVDGAAQPDTHRETQGLSVQLSLETRGYSADATGSGSIARLRELAYMLGVPRLDAADLLSGSVADVSLHAAGPWLPAEGLGSDAAGDDGNLAATPEPQSKTAALNTASMQKTGHTAAPAVQPVQLPVKDMISGTVTLRSGQWAPKFLAFPVSLSRAALNFSGDKLNFVSDFTYGKVKEAPKPAGPAKSPDTNPDTKESADVQEPADVQTGASGNVIHGTVLVQASPDCQGTDCAPHVQIHLGTIDAAQFQAVLLNTPQPKGFLAPLIDKVRPAEPAQWPAFVATIDAQSLVLGPVVLQSPSVQIRPKGGDFVLESWHAGLLGGSAQGSGRISWTNNRPSYSLDGNFRDIGGSALGAIAGSRWSGGTMTGSGQVQLAGLIAKDLAASTTGNVNFDWRNGTVLAGSGAAGLGETPSAGVTPVRFDDWSGKAAFADGKVQLGQNALVKSGQSSMLAGSMTFGGPAAFTLPARPKVAAQSARPLK